MFKSNLFHSLMDNGNFRKLMFHVDLGDFVFIPSSILTIRLWDYIEKVRALFFIFIKKETVFHTNTWRDLDKTWEKHLQMVRNTGRRKVFWNFCSRATVLVAFLVEVCNALKVWLNIQMHFKVPLLRIFFSRNCH